MKIIIQNDTPGIFQAKFDDQIDTKSVHVKRESHIEHQLPDGRDILIVIKPAEVWVSAVLPPNRKRKLK